MTMPDGYDTTIGRIDFCFTLRQKNILLKTASENIHASSVVRLLTRFMNAYLNYYCYFRYWRSVAGVSTDHPDRRRCYITHQMLARRIDVLFLSLLLIQSFVAIITSLFIDWF